MSHVFRRPLLFGAAAAAAFGADADAIMPMLPRAGGSSSACFATSSDGGGCLIDKLVGGTVVLGAWSMARRLRNAYTGYFFEAAAPAGQITNAMNFPSTSQCTLSITAGAEFQAYVTSYTSADITLWYDQSGQISSTNGTFGNVMKPQKGGNAGYPRIAGGGAFNQPINGYPAISVGYSATYSTSNAPSISMASTSSGIPMAIPVGTPQFWFVAAVRAQAGSGSTTGRLASLYATVDGFPGHDSNTTTSAIVMGWQGAPGSALEGYRDSTTLSAISVTTSVMIVASVFDGSTQQTWVNGVAGAAVASTGDFGAACYIGMGDIANGGGAAPNYPFAADIVEALCGTTIAPADLQTAMTDMADFYAVTI